MKKFVAFMAVLFAALWSSADVPQLINYQGRLLDGTNLVNGSVGLSLRLFTVPGGGVVLYEDSNSVAVVDGSYSTFIGDNPASSAFLTALTNAAVYLEVAVNGTALAPRERLTSVAYALQASGALLAQGVAPNGVTSAMIATGAVQSVHLAAGAVSNVNLATGSVGAPQLASDIGVWARNGTAISYSSGNVGIGTVTPAEPLEVVGRILLNGDEGNLHGDDISSLANSGRLLIGANRSGGEGEADFIANRGGGNVGGFSFYDMANDGTLNQLMTMGGNGRVGIGTATPTHELTVQAPSGGDVISFRNPSYELGRLGMGAHADSGSLWLKRNGLWNVAINADDASYLNGGNVGIGTATPAEKLEVAGRVLLNGPEANLDGADLLALTNSAKMLIGWNLSRGEGEADFIADRGAGWGGGFAFYDLDTYGRTNQLLSLKGDGSCVVGKGSAIDPTASGSTIAGGTGNSIQRGSVCAFLGGGALNTIQEIAWEAFLGGGSENCIQTSAKYVFLGGGYGNTIHTNAAFTVLGGGIANNIETNADGSFLGGGWNNQIQGSAQYSVLGGGSSNTIAVAAEHAVIAGGYGNTASNWYATVPGGAWNVAGGQGSFAAGRGAKALHDGSFVWNDFTSGDLLSISNNSVTMRALGGYRLFSAASNGVALPNGGGSWTSMSDRNAKENFAEVDADAILAKIAALPVLTWNYKTQDAAIRHIGPMAQDFKAAFHVGESETGITTVDADGIALAAIQGLNSQVSKLQSENAELKAKLDEVMTRLDAMVPTK